MTRSFNQGMHPGDSSGFMPMHPPPHLMAPNESGTHLSRSSLSSPMSDSCVKLEPSEDSVSADGSVSRDELDLESKTPHNELLKQLLGTGQNGRQLPTPDSEDSLPSLTPEQQRQLEMIDSMPLCKETEISTPEWEAKTPEEKEKIMEMRKQEYEQKRQEYEVSRKNKRKTLTGTPIASTEKKKRKAKGIVEVGIELPKKRLKKSKLKENQIKELEAQAETFLQQLHNMPPISLQEPIIATSMSILPVKGATSFTGISALKGRYCSAYLENIEDMYGSLLFPQPPPGLRPTPASAETLAQRQLASEAKIRMMQGIDAIQMLKAKEGLQGPRPGPRTSPRLILPPQPRIEIKSEQMRERKEERETPDTIVSSSSPEFGFNDQEPEFPGLRPIDPATNNDIKLEDTTSPVVPLVHPLPVKPALSMKESSGLDVAIKHEFGLMKQDSSDLDHGMAGPSAGVEQLCRDLTVNLPNLTSGLAQPFLDPALDQQVSVTLTLSTGAAQDIGAVISAIADLLKIAVPPTYEITRSPSPEMFRMSLTHKEEAVNIHTLMSARPRFCQHCDVFVLCSGIAKYKREFPILLEQDPECGGDDEMIFCSMNCSMQFSVALETRQRQAQLRIKDESGPSSAQSPPPSGVKLEIPSGALTPTSATVSSNVDEIIAAVAADTSLSPDTPGEMSGSPGTPSTTPTSPFSSASPFKSGKRHRRSSSQISDSAFPKPVLKKWRGLRWKRGNQELLDSIMKLPSTPVHELDKLWQSLGMIHRPKADVLDSRKCLFCHNVGDGESDGPSRLLNVDINKWVHLNCALWSYDVYETLNGALMNVEVALERSITRECVACRKMGATLPCFKSRCTNAFHMPCARLKGCMFYQDKTMLCPTHIPKVAIGNEMSTLVVLRRVYINRDEDRQVASMFHQEDGHCCLRVGSLILHSIGQLLPHQILCGKFNTKDYIYPVGFKTSRFYWSYYSLYQRCRYICSIHDNDGEPEFRIQIVDSNHEELVFKDSSPAAVWMHILKPLEHMRREADLVKMFPSFKAAEDLFGLTDQNIVKVLESLPGTDLLQGYNFKYGRSPLIEMPPAINPTGCARAEPKLRTHFRRPHTLQSTNSRSLPSTVTGVSGDINSPYLKQFVHSKSQQYRRLKTDWKSLVYLGRSRIQGLGLYAARDLEKHTMVIEYIGDLIRNEVANRREKEYESQNRGVYMFRIDNDVVIDATMAGGPARYINHSCNPNCVAEVVDIEKESKIIIITSRKIVKGEELTYDYKFDFEDDQHKIPCMCGATGLVVYERFKTATVINHAANIP
ncbi:Histone-lysine N-methyltransferase 2C [Bulinus truncatus]|nr:Histone-lysine N-methyltransferase 2C [Bulinus truncatus]